MSHLVAKSRWVQGSLFSSGHRKHAGLGIPWGALTRARVVSEGVAPVWLPRRGGRESGLIVRPRPEWGEVRTQDAHPAAHVEVQTFDEGGFPLLSTTVFLIPDDLGTSFGLLYDFSDSEDRELFEGLSRQARLPLQWVSREGNPVGRDFEVPLTLWNRVQVYQALESAQKIAGTKRSHLRSFVIARARWEARHQLAPPPERDHSRRRSALSDSVRPRAATRLRPA